MWRDPAQMTVAELASVIFALIGVIGFVVAFLPPTLAFLGLTRLWFWGRECDSDLELVGADEEYYRLAEELVRIGFRPFGKTVKRAIFMGHNWARTFRSQKLIASDGLVYATMYRLLPGSPWRVTFSTVLDGGCLVETAFPGIGLTKFTPENVRTEFGQKDLSAAENRHRHNVKQVAAASGQRPIQVGLDDLLRIEKKVSRESVSGGKSEVFALPLSWLITPAAVFTGLRILVSQFLGKPGGLEMIDFGIALGAALPVYAVVLF